MAKIKVTNPVVELDGDEMTRIIWDEFPPRILCVSGHPLHPFSGDFHD